MRSRTQNGVALKLAPSRGADMNLGLAFPYRCAYLRRALALVAITTAWLASPVLSAPQPSSELPVIVLVRHANKAAQPTDDPPLTPDGVKRAQDLVATLRNFAVSVGSFQAMSTRGARSVGAKGGGRGAVAACPLRCRKENSRS